MPTIADLYTQPQAKGYNRFVRQQGGFDIQGLLAYLSSEQARSNQANEQRYGEARGLVQGGTAGALAQMDTFGRTAKEDINRTADERIGQGTNDAINRGLYNSSYLDAMKSRQNEARDRGLRDVDERVAANRAGIIERGASQEAGIVERRTDAAPTLGQFAPLIASIEESRRSAFEAQRERKRMNAPRDPQTPRQTVPIYGPGGQISYFPLDL